MLSYLILGITFAFAAAVQPGPLQSYLISQALRKGWKHTLPAAFAPVISDGPIIILAMFVLSNISESIVNLLYFAGGVFVLYLAMDAWKAWKKFDSEKIIQSASSRTTLSQAVTVNFLNPAPYLGWSLVMGPILLNAWRESYFYGIALLLAFYTTIVVSQMAIVILFSQASRLGAKIERVLLGLSAVGLFCFGIYELWLGVKFLQMN
ncbi:MAG: LysE family transporter [Bacteroidetes bacterium]|nr:LysE family transporter [Bacteroidota bacterium]